MSSLTIALISGVLYFLGTSRIGYSLSASFGAPVMLGAVYGLLFGDLATGLIIGGSINLLYLGVVFTGGNVPTDAVLAATIAIPIAFQANLSPDLAVAIAVPFGILGAFIDQIRRTSNLIWLHLGDRYAALGNEKGIYLCAMVYPTIVAFFIRFIPVFVINLFGAEAVSYVVNELPKFIITGLSVAGGILPAIGFSIIILQIGRKELLPYFFMGFFAVQYLGINTMACAVFGACIALLLLFNDLKGKKVS